MLNGVYKNRESARTVKEQIEDWRNATISYEGYGFNVVTLEDVPFGEEHSCDFPVLLMRHPNNYLYIYPLDGNEDHGEVRIKTEPCGIVKFDPFVVTGPMFKDDWLATEKKGFLETKVSLKQMATYMMAGNTRYVVNAVK